MSDHTPNTHKIRHQWRQCLLLGSLAIPAVVLADPILLPSMEVMANRLDLAEQLQSRTTQKMNGEQIERLQPLSVGQALEQLPNVQITGGVVAQNQSINIRGLEGAQILQLIDGARNNLSFAHRPSYLLDPALLSSVSVVMGSASSLWGSGAIGGVVSQQTLLPEDVIDEGERQGGFLQIGGQDNGNLVRSTAAFARKMNEQWSFLVAGSASDNDHLEQGGGSTNFGTEAEQQTFLGKLFWEPSDQHRLALNMRLADAYSQPPSVGGASGQDNSENVIERNLKDQHIGFDYDQKNTWGELKAKLYYNNTDNQEDNLFNGQDQSDLSTIGLTLTQSIVQDNRLWLVGIDGFQDTIKVDRSINPTNANRPDLPDEAQTNVWGAFVNLVQPLSKSVSVDLGLRYDSFETKADDRDSSGSDSEISASAGIQWQANNWLSVGVRYDEAFRAPASDELYTQGTHFTYSPVPGWENSFIPNPDLEAEDSRNFSVTLATSFENIWAEDTLAMSLTGFVNHVENLIFLDVVTIPEFGPPPACNCVSGTSTPVNAQEADLEGLEFTLDYRLKNLTVVFGYGHTRGVSEVSLNNSITREALAQVPADKLTLDVSWKMPQGLVGVNVIEVKMQDRVPSGSTRDKFDGYTLTDLYASWQPEGGKWEDLSIDLRLKNAFDQKYRRAWSEVFEPGRAISVAARYEF